MDSAKLSARARQPGNDVTFRASEKNFIAALELVLDPDLWEVVDHPKDLTSMLGGHRGILPEAKIIFLPTGKYMYFEVKKQGPTGNAEERAAKHHTVQFYKELHAITGLDYHPYVTIMCENLATDDKYIVKHPYFFEPDHYFCWVDYDLESLAAFLDNIAGKWLVTEYDGELQAVPE